MHDYAGDFEMHVTARAEEPAVLERFREWCGERGMKCVRIVLSRGSHVEQPMATWRRTGSTLAAVLAEANDLAAEANRDAAPIVRVKVEAAPFNADVPADDANAARHPAENYFEHHIKLVRDVDADRSELIGLCEDHAAHLSRNAFREPAAGREERFVTLRGYGIGRTTSDADLDRLLAALGELGETVVEHESEYCVYDSNLALDAGWLPAG